MSLDAPASSSRPLPDLHRRTRQSQGQGFLFTQRHHQEALHADSLDLRTHRTGLMVYALTSALANSRPATQARARRNPEHSPVSALQISPCEAQYMCNFASAAIIYPINS